MRQRAQGQGRPIGESEEVCKAISEDGRDILVPANYEGGRRLLLSGLFDLLGGGNRARGWR